MQGFKWIRHFVIALAVCLCSVVQAEQSIRDKLVQPGVHVLMRHALAPGMGDPSNFQLEDCTTQRILNHTGRQQATQIGQLLRDQGVSFNQVFSSQWCRCLKTAQLMAMGKVQPAPMLNSFFRDPSTAKSQTQDLRELLNSLPQHEKALLVTHQVNITALTGIFPRSGEMILVAVSGNSRSLKVIGRFLPNAP
ncbi:histidine phosphatase family protein [Marinomonas posidonica]|uniref:Phosphoglycerate mutase n=1 Tax=Marinomonas posidonica (strain CECT 7376 / NCIMB 14433 / IVIA-Po-181) TaxID=491952 RepID=F6CV45_MARPP|nr:histidine phosphatase family protein [Marinomonas posidonica]AEF56465.1 Phosphoglycerate mutase [Marinomonas posidonica IVIA-Po-181]